MTYEYFIYIPILYNYNILDYIPWIACKIGSQMKQSLKGKV